MKKRNFKRILKGIFTVLLTIGSLFGNFTVNTKAAGYTLTVTTPYGRIMSPDDKWAIGTNTNVYGYDVYSPLYINGVHVYCIQINAISVDGAGDYSPVVLGSYTGNESLTRKLEYISSLGYGFNGDYSQEMDFATQIRIWQEMGVGSVTNIHPDIQAKINQINARLNVMYTNVSFNNQWITVHGYGKEFAQSVEDTNGVLSCYQNYDLSGIHSERNGNTLTVWAEEGDSLISQLQYDCYYSRNQSGTSIAYMSGSSQDVAFLAGINPTSASVNVRVQLGTIQLTKSDFERDDDPQGDATFEGATFDVVDDKTSQSIGTLVADSSGTTNKIEKLPTDRTYTIKETTAPVGYNLSEESKHVDFSTIGSEEDTIKNYTDKFADNVKTGSMELRKVITTGEESEIVTPEVDAEFIVMLKKYVDQYGSIEEAYKHTDEYSNREWDYLTTDKDGNTYTKRLAYGKYVVKQVAGKDETDLLKKSFTFDIDEQDKHFQYTINNIPSEYYVKLVKKDKDTGKVVTLNSASFKIKDSEGNYVTMKVGGRNYDTFTTSSDGGVGVFTTIFGSTYYDADDTKGTVITPLTLTAGKYTVEEIKTPDGFLDTDPVEFTIKKDYVTETSEDDDKYIEVVIENEQPTGTLKVSKTIEDYDADTSFVDHKCLKGITFTLSAKEDVISAIDGSTLYAKGQIVGTYETNENGKFEVNDLPMGSYTLKETKTLDGLVLDEEEHAVVFEAKDTTTKTYKVNCSIENKTTKVEFSKKSVTGQDELDGAELTVKDENGGVIDSWTSGKKTHIIEGLIVGKSYTLEESVVVDGYVKASNIEFTISNTGEVQSVNMIDKQMKISKTDVGGKEVSGAKLVVTDEDGNIIDEWVSDDQEHNVNGLEAGNTYILKEEVAPRGFVKVSEVKFTVGDDGLDQYFDLVDTIETIQKVDQSGNIVIGSKLQILDETGTVVDEWTVGNNVLETLDSSLKTEMKDTGMKVTTSNKEDGKVNEKEIYTLIVCDESKKDETEKYSYYYVDEDGNELLHRASNLVAEASYTLHEIEAPENYKTSEDITFTAPNDSDETLEMIDTKLDKVSITKYSATSKKELPGAKLKVMDKDGKTVDEWTSTKEEHIIENIIVGDTYTLVEETAPNGYLKAESIQFTVEDNGAVVQKVSMYDNVKKGTNTGIENHWKVFVLGTVIGFLGIVLLTLKKKIKFKS